MTIGIVDGFHKLKQGVMRTINGEAENNCIFKNIYVYSISLDEKAHYIFIPLKN